MNNINLTSNKYIRNIILFADLLIALGVIVYFIEFDNMKIEHPSVLLILSIISMAVSQAWFSTILHHHYASFDKVMARTTALHVGPVGAVFDFFAGTYFVYNILKEKIWK